MRLVLVTGASRAGKTRYATQLAHADPVSLIVHQDAHYRDFHAVPAIKFPACVKSTRNYDCAQAVDWEALLMHVNDAFAIAARTHADTVIVEGTELFANRPLCDAADLIVVLQCGKWTCYARRIGVRQCYLPYLEQMWDHHVQLMTTHARSYAAKLCIVPPDTEPGPLNQLRLSGAERYAEFVAELTADALSKHPGFVPLNELCAPLIDLLDTTGTDMPLTVAAAWLGHALGDAFGAPYEFPRGRRPQIESFALVGHVHVGRPGRRNAASGADRSGARGAAPGAVTDDHMMLLQLARTIVKNGGRYSKDAAIAAYIEWAQARPTGMGYNTRALFQSTTSKNPETQRARYDAAFAAAHRVGAPIAGDTALVDDDGFGDLLADDEGGVAVPRRSISNGSLMRCAGMLLHRGTRAEVQQAAVDDASVSNDWPENRAANRLYIGLLCDLVFGDRRLTDVCQWADDAYLRANTYSRVIGDADVVLRVAEDALRGVAQRASLDGAERGCVLTALWAALRTARDFAPVHKGNVGEALRVLVIGGGDTDTNAAIAGALLGASIGWQSLVRQQRANVETVMNVPYEYCTMRNVLGLQPRSIVALLRRWTGADETKKRRAETAGTSAKAQRTE